MIKKNVKRILALMLAVIMIMALTVGCKIQGEKPVDSAGQTTPDVADKSDTYSKPEPYEFTMYVNYDWYDASAKWGDDEISKILQEKFNIKMNVSKPEGDPNQKLSVMIATDDLPDAIQMDRDPIYLNIVQLGKAVAIDNYINDGSEYAKVVPQGTINLSKVDGKTYGMLNWSTTTDHPTGNNGWVVNKKIYELLGSPKLDTTDQLFEYLMKVKEENLTVDGRPVIPLQFAIFPEMSELMCASFGVKQVEGVVPIDGQLELFYNDPRTTDALLFMNKLWNNDLVNKDYFVEKSEQVQEKLTNGRVAVYAGNDISENLNNLRIAMKERDSSNDYIVIHPPAASGVDQSEIYNSTYSTLGWNINLITNKAKEPERIFQLLDYIISPEGCKLVSYGPKGSLYEEEDENGYPILKKALSSLSSEESKELGIVTWRIIGNTLFTDQSKVADDNRRPIDERDWVIQAQTNILWKHSLNVDAYTGFTPDLQSEIGIAFNSFNDLNLKQLPKIITANSVTLAEQAIKETIENAYKLGFEKVEEFKNDIYFKNLKLLND